MPPKRRKKTRKDISIHIRVTAEQRKVLKDAADKNGLGLSTYLLTTGLKAAHADQNPQS